MRADRSSSIVKSGVEPNSVIVPPGGQLSAQLVRYEAERVRQITARWRCVVLATRLGGELLEHFGISIGTQADGIDRDGQLDGLGNIIREQALAG
jgi:hypothetical protein